MESGYPLFSEIHEIFYGALANGGWFASYGFITKSEVCYNVIY